MAWKTESCTTICCAQSPYMACTMGMTTMSELVSMDREKPVMDQLTGPGRTAPTGRR